MIGESAIIAAYESGTRKASPRMLERLRKAAKPYPSQVLLDHMSEIVACCKRNHATNVKAFASVARGEDEPGSDLDLLVTFDDTVSIYEHAQLVLDLEALLGLKVDVIEEAALKDEDAAIRAQAIAL